MGDILVIKGLDIFAYHGVNEEEKEYGQKFTIDLEMEATFHFVTCHDNLDLTLSYSEVKKAVEHFVKTSQYNLLEALAENMAKMLFENFSTIKSIILFIKKSQAPMKGCFKYVGVKISRERTDYIE